MKGCSNLFLWLIFSVLTLASCNHKDKNSEDAPGYHNPLVQPLTTALLEDPDNAQLLFQRSQALLQVQSAELAQKDLIQALKIDSNNLQYQFALSQVDLKINHNTEAISILEKILPLSHHAPVIQIALAKAYLQNKQPKPAKAAMQSLIKTDSAYPGALFILAQINLEEKDTNTAINILKKSIKLRSNDYPASLLLAKCFAAKHSQKAVAQYRQTFKMDTTDVTPLVRIGLFFEQEKQVEKAKMLYRESLLKDPDCTLALMRTGEILLLQDSTTKALRHFKIAIQTKPNSADAYLQKGICFERLHQKDSAKVAFAQALVFNASLKAAKEGWARNK